MLTERHFSFAQFRLAIGLERSSDGYNCSARSNTVGSSRNVILFIPDGFGPAHGTMARDFKRDYLQQGPSLVMDDIEVGGRCGRSRPTIG
jgi:alkaline phosphatase